MNIFFSIFSSVLLLTSNLAMAEPTLLEVNQAIESGQFAKADALVKEVLQNHPNSAKAHYMSSELYVKQGKLDAARIAFAKADGLAPGLPFAQPERLKKLKAELSVSSTQVNTRPLEVQAPTPSKTNSPVQILVTKSPASVVGSCYALMNGLHSKITDQDVGGMTNYVAIMKQKDSAKRMFESKNVFSGNKGTRADFDDWNFGYNSTSRMGNKEFDGYKASDFLKAYQICMSGLN